MARRRNSETERARLVLAQEAARIIVDHGVRDYRVAKQKAAERLGVGSRGSLPGNTEIEAAVAEHLQLFVHTQACWAGISRNGRRKLGR
jgi:hypothetical protein